MAKKSRTRKIIAGRYAYEKPLGKGAGGAVYLAEDLFSEDSRYVALKVITAEAANSVQGTMLRREYSILTNLEHRNLVRVYDFGTLPGGGIYLAEEFIDGFSLQDARALLEPNQLIEITVQILEGLAYMHAMGTIHRDIKPANVMILWPDDPSSKPLTKLVDFGLSSRNTVGDTLRGGTRSYMAPEVIRGDRAEFRSDLYSLGVTLYYAMCGVIPFGPRGKDDPPVSEEQFRPPEPHRINPAVPLSLSRFTMILLRQVPGADLYDAGQALRTLIEDVDERTHSFLKQFNVDVASSSVLRGTFELGLIGFRDEQRKKHIFENVSMDQPGRFIVITGPPDVGKTRLIRAIGSDYKLKGATVIEVRADFLERRFGYAIDIISQLIALIRSSNIKGVNHVSYFLGIITTLVQCGDLKDESVADVVEKIPARLFDAFLYLKSLLNPKHLVIIIDDIDTIPPVAITSLFENIGGSRALGDTTFIISGRDSDSISVAVNAPGTEHFPLGGFELSDLNHFIFKQLGLKGVPPDLIEDFYEHADDDTVFILEICNLLLENGMLHQQSVSKWTVDLEHVLSYKVPRTLSLVVKKRLDNLSPDTRRVVELLSLVRFRIERSIVRNMIISEQIHEDPEQVLNQLQNRNYIVFDFLPDGCFLRVTNHGLLYFVRSSLDPQTREHYHATIATHMVKGLDNGKVTPLDIAQHFEKAGKNYYWEAAVYYQEAANALLMEAPGSDSKFILDAIEFFKKSLELTEHHEHIDIRTTLNRKLALANALLQLGKVENAQNLIHEIWDQLVHIPESSIWLKYSTVAAGMRAEVVGGTPRNLQQWEDRLVEHLPNLIHQPQVALIRAWHCRVQGNFGLAFELVRRAKIRSELFYSHTAIEAEAAYGRLYEEIGQLHLAYRHYEHALEMAKLNDLPTEHAWASIGIGRILIRSNRLPEAESYIFEGFNSAVCAGRPDLTAEALIEEGQILSKLGSYRDAAQRAEDALQVSKLVHHVELQARSRILQAIIMSQQGELAKGIAILEEIDQRVRIHSCSYSFSFQIELQKTLGRMLVDNGQDAGRQLYEDAVAAEQSLDMRTTLDDLIKLNFNFRKCGRSE